MDEEQEGEDAECYEDLALFLGRILLTLVLLAFPIAALALPLFSTCVLIGWIFAPACYVLLLLHRLYLFAVLGDQILQLWLRPVWILDWLRLPVHFPSLFGVELVDDVVNVPDLRLVFSLPVVLLCFDMGLEIFIVAHTNLAISVVGLRFGHRDYVASLSENAFRF